MAFTAAQLQSMRQAWDSGVRDDASLLAAANMGAAPSPGFESFAQPQDPGFIDEGGALGLISRAPGVSTALGALEFLGRRLEDVGSVVGLTAEAGIPGLQPQERALREGWTQARAQGEGVIPSAFSAWEQAQEAKILPVTAQLPFEISYPDWVMGRDKTLQTIDLDLARIAQELPGEIFTGRVVGKGITGLARASRPARRAMAETLPPPFGIGRQATTIVDDIPEWFKGTRAEWNQYKRESVTVRPGDPSATPQAGRVAVQGRLEAPSVDRPFATADEYMAVSPNTAMQLGWLSGQPERPAPFVYTPGSPLISTITEDAKSRQDILDELTTRLITTTAVETGARKLLTEEATKQKEAALSPEVQQQFRSDLGIGKKKTGLPAISQLSSTVADLKKLQARETALFTQLNSEKSILDKAIAATQIEVDAAMQAVNARVSRVGTRKGVDFIVPDVLDPKFTKKVLPFNANWRTAGPSEQRSTTNESLFTSRWREVPPSVRTEIRALAEKERILADKLEGYLRGRRNLEVSPNTRTKDPRLAETSLVNRIYDVRNQKAVLNRKLNPMLDSASSVLAKKYSDLEGGIYGTDLVSLGQGVSSTTRDVLAMITQFLRDRERAQQKLPEGRQRIPESRPFPLDIEEGVAELVADQIAYWGNLVPMIKSATAARYDSMAEARANGLTGRHPLEPNVNGFDITDEHVPGTTSYNYGKNLPATIGMSLPDGAFNGPSAVTTYRTIKSTSLKEEAESKIVEGVMARLADWARNSLISSAIDLPPGQSETRRGLERIAAWTLVNVPGQVNPTALRQNIVFRASSAYQSQMQYVMQQAEIDNARALRLILVDQLDLEDVEKGIRFHTHQDVLLRKVYPVTKENIIEGDQGGRWANTDFAAQDILEAYWAHLDSATTPAVLRNFLKDRRGGKIERTFFLNRNYDETEEVFRTFFKSTAEAGSTKVAIFAKELKVYYEEIRASWYETLTPKQKLRADNLPAGTFLPREVIEFASGGKPLKSGPTFEPIQRIYADQSAGMDAGVQFDHNLTRHLILLDAAVRKAEIQKEFSDLMLDPAQGVAIGITGLAGRVSKYYTENPAARELLEGTPKTKKFVEGLEKDLRDIEEKYAARYAEADGNEDIIRMADVERIDELNKVNKKVIVAINGHDPQMMTDLPLPSKIFFANNEDYITVEQLRDLMGVGTQVDIRSIHEKFLGRVGLSEVAILQRNEVIDIMDSFKVIDDLVNSEDTPAKIAARLGKPSQGLKLATEVAGWWRMNSTGFDFAIQATVLLPLLFYSPKNWWTVTTESIRSFFDTDTLPKYFDNHPEAFQTLHQMTMAGVSIGDIETYTVLNKSPKSIHISKEMAEEAGAPDDYGYGIDEDGLLNTWRVRSKEPGALSSKYEKGKSGYKWAIRRFANSYNSGATLGRLFLFDAFRHQFTDVNTGKVDWVGVRSSVNNMTGALNLSDLGRSTSAKRVESLVVGLSPRLTRAIAAMVWSAQKGAVRIAYSRDKNLLIHAVTQGRKGRSPFQEAQRKADERGTPLSAAELKTAREATKEVLALGNLSTMLFVSMAGFYMLNMIHAYGMGASEEEAKQIADSSVDPLQGKRFLAMPYGESWIGIGGFWRSLASLQWQLIYGAAEGVQGNFQPMNKFTSADRFGNPLLALYGNRGAPAIEFFGKVGEGLTGKDLAPFDVIENKTQIPRSMVESSLPFAIQGLVEGEGVDAFLFGLLGARTSKMTPADALVEVTRRRFNLSVDNSMDISEAWFKREVLYPIVEDEYALSSRASNSPLALFQERREELKASFLTEIQNEYAAGNKDYELLSLYYDKRQIMYERLDEYEEQANIGQFDVDAKDPIAIALQAWRKIYDTPEVVQSLKDDRWDVIDALRADLLAGFTQEQRDAVLRSGSGIHAEIGNLLRPESQQRYLDLFNRRKDWLISKARTREDALTAVSYLWGNMFPSLQVSRGITPESIGKVAQMSYGAMAPQL